MVGMVEGGAVDDELNMTKIRVKLVILWVVRVLAVTGRKKASPQTTLWGTIGALSVANIFITVLWRKTFKWY